MAIATVVGELHREHAGALGAVECRRDRRCMEQQMRKAARAAVKCG